MEGGEGLKVAGREDLEPENSGISDLISSSARKTRGQLPLYDLVFGVEIRPNT